MCIMAMPVRSVSNTRIFIGRNADRQLTIYEMSVELATPGNAMILPVPAESAGDVTLINMEQAPKFFDDLDRVFQPMTLGMSKGARRSRGVDHLQVHEVGSYLVSIAEGLADLDRLNPEVFQVSPAAMQALGPHYSRVNGQKHVFIVAQLTESGKFHPLAYTHPVPAEGLFVPTRHEHGHDHEAHPHGDRADWDHHIYFQDREAKWVELPGLKDRTERRANESMYEMISKWAGIYSERVPELSPFLDTDQHCRASRARFAGRLRNMDLRLSA